MKKNILATAFILLLVACKSEKEIFVNENIHFSETQTEKMIQLLEEKNEICYPRSINTDGSLRTTAANDWTDGFFPGSLWYLYELTGKEIWKERALAWTEPLEPLKNLTAHHDIGFLMYCSFGNGVRLNPDNHYKDILIQSAKSALKRYNDTVQSIESWNQRKSWDDSTMWYYPVIIDNMMNLELLFWASKTTGDDIYRNVAIKHANTTLKNHIREDFSTYHVVDYDELTGEVKDRATCQGFSDNSTWARGQAWAIYGFTLMYRETNEKKYLDAATSLADFFLNNANLPKDKIPFWDFNVGQEGYTPEWNYNPIKFKEIPRDASAAAIVASALFELDNYAKEKNYRESAIQILYSLASPDYRAKVGTNAGFLLMHCVGSIPHNTEIDVPLVYADYYFLEALLRYKNSKQ